MEAGHTCRQCGKAFEPTCHTSRQVYCSNECRIKYNNTKRYAPPGNACVECGAMLEQSGSVGKNRRFCSDECRIRYHRKKDAEKKRAERQKPRICPNCGKEFVPMWEKGGIPRFCSDECRIMWWREYNKVTPRAAETSGTCAYCGREMGRGEGKYCSRACYRLGAAQVRGERRCTWCGKILPKKARTGQKYCSQACATSAWRLVNHTGPRKGCITTRNQGAWRKQLAKLAREAEITPKKDRRIFLICGVRKVAGTEALIDFIRYELQCDPFDGNLYLFCGGERSQLKWLEWDGSGFCVGLRNAEWGRYPWPEDQAGTIMEITEQEFAFLRERSTLVNEAADGTKNG